MLQELEIWIHAFLCTKSHVCVNDHAPHILCTSNSCLCMSVANLYLAMHLLVFVISDNCFSDILFNFSKWISFLWLENFVKHTLLFILGHVFCVPYWCLRCMVLRVKKNITHMWRRWDTPQSFSLAFINELEKKTNKLLKWANKKCQNFNCCIF